MVKSIHFILIKITSIMTKYITRAIAKNIRISPYKLRRIANLVRGCSYPETLMILEFLPYCTTNPIWQVIYSAAANAKNNHQLKKKDLKIETIFVNEGSKLKRIRPRAKGKTCRIIKPTSHITVTLSKLILN